MEENREGRQGEVTRQPGREEVLDCLRALNEGLGELVRTTTTQNALDGLDLVVALMRRVETSIEAKTSVTNEDVGRVDEEDEAEECFLDHARRAVTMVQVFADDWYLGPIHLAIDGDEETDIGLKLMDLCQRATETIDRRLAIRDEEALGAEDEAEE